MKKFTVILAACAMFAFAACNKDNEKGYTLNDDNTINIVIGADSPIDADNGGKQALHGERMQILFTTEDQIMVNQNVYDISLRNSNIAGVPAGVSNRAAIYGIAQAPTYEFYFTAATYTVDGDDYKVEMLSEVDLLGNNVSNAFTAANQAWPMYAQFSDPTEVENGLLLRNAVAVLSPAIVYGTGWADVAFASFYEAGHSFLPAELPEITVTDVVINADTKLTGWSTLNAENPTEPIIVMDNALTAGTRDKVICHIPVANQYTLDAPMDQRAVINVLGNLPIAPTYNPNTEVGTRPTYQLNLYFSAVINGQTYYYKFETVDSRARFPHERNYRDWLQVNFQTVSSTVAPVVNADGSITFSNGTLSAPSATPYEVI